MNSGAQRSVMACILLGGVLCCGVGAIAQTSQTSSNQPAAIPVSVPAAPSTAPAPARNDPPASPAVAPAAPRTDASRAQTPAPPAKTATRPAVAPPSPPAGNSFVSPEQEALPLGKTTASGSGGVPAHAATQGSSWVLNTLTALGIVIGLIVGVRILLVRLGGPVRSSASGGLVEVLARTSIAPRISIVFLRINQRVIVAAQTPAGMSTLTDLGEEDTAWLLGRIESQKPLSITQGFRQLVSQFDRQYTQSDAAAPGEGRDESEHVVDRTRSELSGLLSRIRNLKDRKGD